MKKRYFTSNHPGCCLMREGDSDWCSYHYADGSMVPFGLPWNLVEEDLAQGKKREITEAESKALLECDQTAAPVVVSETMRPAA